MAHKLYNLPVLSKAALSSLRNRTLLAGLVWRDAESDFGGTSGHTVTIRRPPSFVAKDFDRATGIQPQDIKEFGIPVVLDKFKDVSVVLGSEELLLDLRDFNEQVITPALQAIADAMEAALVATLDTLPATLTWDTTDPLKTLTKARMILQRLGAPMAGRSLVLSPEAATLLLDTDTIRRADANPGGPQALREGYIGRLSGFDLFEHTSVPEDTGHKAAGYAFHREALSLVSRAPAPPAGGTESSSQSFEGFAIRSTRGYSLEKKTDIASFDTLFGAKLLDHRKNEGDPAIRLGLRISMPGTSGFAAMSSKAEGLPPEIQASANADDEPDSDPEPAARSARTRK
ncbi:P22 phage major capsid protein family protein [Actinomadura litoris]|uniref:P22 phage major capsid protein family protein n=1 Tax=Actinomadura litoris TaxID=2678616 RepID=UPI001FA72172|nr:P22 phage major capsid protein family protein [Actinomadura litoris]